MNMRYRFWLRNEIQDYIYTCPKLMHSLESLPSPRLHISCFLCFQGLFDSKVQTRADMLA